MCIKKGMEHDAFFLLGCKALANDLSQNVFNGAPVDVHLCDEYLETIRVVPR
jgi:hypothetical protein